MHSTIIQPRQGFYSLEKANEMAATLTEGDQDGWRYDVIDCKNGLGRIDVYDDQNILVHKGFYI